MRVFAVVVCAVLVFSAAAGAYGTKGKRARPEAYGNVVIDNASRAKGVAPVVFKHWVHRAKYTCRLCHMDIGFAMNTGATGITEQDNLDGMYCGTCHNGTTAFAPKAISPEGTEVKNCDRCHSLGKDVAFTNDFRKFRKGLPRERFGNRIDWQSAEEQKLIVLKDFIEGVSIHRPKLKDPEEIEVTAKATGMPNIVFSHEKHAVWNGCEVCHPELFGVKKGDTPYSMKEIFQGKFCGVCHGFVAFPNNDCQRCHTKPVF